MVTAGEDAHHVAGRDHVVSTSYFNTGTVLVSKQILVPQVILSILYTLYLLSENASIIYLQVGCDDLIYLYFETGNIF